MADREAQRRARAGAQRRGAAELKELTAEPGTPQSTSIK